MGLEILKYDPNDYKLGEALAHKHGEESSDAETISKIVSLYFQWKAESKAVIYTERDGKKIAIEMEYDNEERVISQLFIKSSQQVNIDQLTHAFIRLEIFDNCFEFESEILDSFLEQGNYFLIVSAPKKISIIKSRKAPRVQTVGKKIIATHNESEIEINCLDIGLQSLKTDSPFKSEAILFLHIDNEKIKAKAKKQDDGSTIIFPLFENISQFGVYFEFYSKIAYPSLVKRESLPFKEGTDLFDRTGYTGKFESEKNLAESHDGLHSLWKELEKAQHETSVDYYITEHNKPVGCSSLALVFKKNNIDHWAFHQLCAEKNPNLIELSGLLYIWRAEYLAARPSELEAVFWYTGSSRWLERIYSKYCLQNPQESLLFASSFIAQDIEPAKTQSLEIKDYQIGSLKRYYYEDQDIVAGMGPDKLNANRNLNFVNWISKNQIDYEKMKKVASELALKNGETTYFRFSFPYNETHPFAGNNLKDLRYCQIHKSGMLNFISCIQHSIAITKKKLQLQNEKDCA